MNLDRGEYPFGNYSYFLSVCMHKDWSLCSLIFDLLSLLGSSDIEFLQLHAIIYTVSSWRSLFMFWGYVYIE